MDVDERLVAGAVCLEREAAVWPPTGVRARGDRRRRRQTAVIAVVAVVPVAVLAIAGTVRVAVRRL